jgi:drug/metabolite transporter (DMT)-like permease
MRRNRANRIIALQVSSPSILSSSPAQVMRPDNIRRGIALILLSSAFFAIMNASVKLLSARFSPIEIGFFRQAFSLVPIVAVMAREGGVAMLRTRRPLGHMFRGLAGNTSMMIFFLSVAWLPLADATALSFAAPLFTTALSAPLLGEKVGRHRWGAVALGFAGVIVMTRPGGDWLTHGAGAGAIAGVAGAFMSAVMMVTIRQLSRTEPGVTIVFYFAAQGCLVFGALLPFVWVAPTLGEWLGFLAVGLVGGFSQLTMTYAYRNAPASSLAPFGYGSIVWSTLLGYALWRNLPDWNVVAGATIVIASGLYIVYRETRRRSAKPPLQALPAID